MPTFFRPVTLSQPIPADVRAAANDVLMHGQQAMPWTGGMQGQAGLIMNAGQWPTVAAPGDLTSDVQQQEQWRQFSAAYKPLTDAVIRGEMAAAKAESVRLAADAAFWDKVHRITLAVATAGMSEAWDRVAGLLAEFKESRRATLKATEVLRSVVSSSTYSPRVPQAQGYLTQVASQQAEIDAGGKVALGPILSLPEVKDAGLGIVPGYAIAAGATAVVLVAVAAAFTYWVKRQSDLKTQANTFAQDVMSARERVDLEDYRAGRITKAEYENRRAQNTQQAIDLSNAMGGSSSAMGLIIGGIALIAGVAVIAKLMRRSGSAPAQV